MQCPVALRVSRLLVYTHVFISVIEKAKVLSPLRKVPREGNLPHKTYQNTAVCYTSLCNFQVNVFHFVKRCILQWYFLQYDIYATNNRLLVQWKHVYVGAEVSIPLGSQNICINSQRCHKL